MPLLHKCRGSVITQCECDVRMAHTEDSYTTWTSNLMIFNYMSQSEYVIKFVQLRNPFQPLATVTFNFLHLEQNWVTVSCVVTSANEIKPGMPQMQSLLYRLWPLDWS